MDAGMGQAAVAWVLLFSDSVTPWTAAQQASPPFTIFRSLLTHVH